MYCLPLVSKEDQYTSIRFPETIAICLIKVSEYIMKDKHYSTESW